MSARPTRARRTARTPSPASRTPKAKAKDATKDTTRGRDRTVAKTRRAPAKKRTIEIARVEYVEMDYALTNASGTASRDRFGTTANAGRTQRFKGAKMYRTKNDEVTIQDSNGDEYILSLSKLEELLTTVKGLGITKQLPAFSDGNVTRS